MPWGTVREAGTIPVQDGDSVHEHKLALLLTFDSIEELREAMAEGGEVFITWPGTAQTRQRP